jgi:hypothetical protein
MFGLEICGSKEFEPFSGVRIYDAGVNKDAAGRETNSTSLQHRQIYTDKYILTPNFILY